MDDDIKQVLLGSMLGDGGLTNPNQCVNAYFRERHSIKQKKYLLWKKSILENEFTVRYYEDRGGKTVGIYTSVNPILTKYHKIFYPTGKGYKIIPIEILKQLKPLGLAVWYMDDGYLSQGSRVRISVYSKDMNTIKEFFEKKFGSKFYVSGGDIWFNKNQQTPRFLNIVKPYIHKSMLYKIKIPENIKRQIKAKRKKWQKSYYEEHKKKAKEYGKEYRKRPEVKERERKYKKKYNPKYYLKNKKKIRKQQKEYRERKRKIERIS